MAIRNVCFGEKQAKMLAFAKNKRKSLFFSIFCRFFAAKLDAQWI